MAQRIFTFLIAVLLSVPLLGPVAVAEVKNKAPVATLAEPKSQKSVEERYMQGADCLKSGDTACTGVVLASINPASPYAKLLRAQMAATTGDYDTPLRLLIPLQAEHGLLPQAAANLHATLALAYEAQDNALYALEQHVRAEQSMDAAALAADQAAVWKLLSAQPKSALVEMRGESPDTVTQGWIDLALAVARAERKDRSIAQWRVAYPDHPAGDALLTAIVATVGATTPAKTIDGPLGVVGKVALLLPQGFPSYAAAAGAVQAGFMTAYKAEAGQAEIKVYDSGGADAVYDVYQRAVSEGAQYVVGPLTRDEVTALVGKTLTAPVLALNQPDIEALPQDNLMFFGLPVDAESRQVARQARERGMQTALVVVGSDPLAQRMAKAFVEEWRTQQGSIAAQLTIPAADGLAGLKAEAAAHPADMIFIAAGAVQAQQVRPYLDIAVPTFGTSHLYDGMPKSVQNIDLVAVHFVDMPWIIDPENPILALYRPADASASADLRRLFALGVDAYRLLPRLTSKPTAGSKLIDGATGTITMGDKNVLERELATAQFRRDGVALESAQ